MSALSAAARSALMSSLADDFKAMAREWPDLWAFVWRGPANKSLSFMPTPFRPAIAPQFDREEVWQSWKAGLRVMLTVSRDNFTRATGETFKQQRCQLAERFQRLVGVAHWWPSSLDPLEQLLLQIAECEWIEALGQHDGFPGWWVGRDGVPQSFNREGAGVDMSTVPRRPPPAWCARIQDVFGQAAMLATILANEPEVKQPDVLSGGRPPVPAVVDRLYVTLLTFHKAGQSLEKTAALARDDAAFREQLDEANSERPPGEKLTLDRNLVKKAQSWQRERRKRGEKKQTGRKG